MHIARFCIVPLTILLIFCEARKYEDAKQVRNFRIGDPIELKIVSDRLEFRDVEGELPRNMFVKLPQLAHLKITGNISYIEPGAFSGLHALVDLDLFQNKIRYLLNGTFKEAHNLKYLNLGENELNYLEPKTFNGLTSLETLNMSFNRDLKVLRDNIYYGLSNLKKLNLIDCGLHDIHRSAFYGLERLESLDLSKNNLKFVTSENFDDLIKMFDLNLSYNRIQQLQANSFSKRLYALRRLNLLYNNMNCTDAKRVAKEFSSTVQVIYRTPDGAGCKAV
ncbi:unnamed protein product [Brassicogethes aeneus]|uniref:Uncharacterized protein n=1 Tax=Brassicogethes aeneus TaxID=1431903 RepID=A0A9P0FKT7_BRAAE|nr:unnamed protein product [Brassicogethes aeneus]